MKATKQRCYQRRFIVSGLPETIAASDPHQQIFDNYIPDSNLRLRKVREPSTDERVYSIEKPVFRSEGLEFCDYSRIFLTLDEYSLFEQFRGRETRKNRYGINIGESATYVDVFLGPLRGLTLLKAEFDTSAESEAFAPPDDVILEVTREQYFLERNLVDANFSDIRDYLSNKKEASG